MKPLIRNLLVLAALAGVAAGLPACHLHFGKPPTTRSWVPLSRAGAESPGYGLYTYVLFANASRRSSHKGDDTQRERALLDAIESMGPNPPGRSPANIFCIPVKSAAPNLMPNPQNYDPKLGDSYRFLIAARTKGGHMARLAAIRLMNNSGPFLVSSASPLHISNASKAKAVLVADFTSADPKDFKATINAYRSGANSSAVEVGATPDPLDFMEHLAKQLKTARVFVQLVSISSNSTTGAANK